MWGSVFIRRSTMAKAGRKPYEPSDESRQIVINLSSIGWPQERIAKGLGINDATLRKHYELELASAEAVMLSQVFNALYANAVEHNNVSAQIFIMKTRGQMKEVSVNELTGKDGAPLNPPAAPIINVNFSDDQIEQGDGEGGRPTQH